LTKADADKIPLQRHVRFSLNIGIGRLTARPKRAKTRHQFTHSITSLARGARRDKPRCGSQHDENFEARPRYQNEMTEVIDLEKAA
jgi:hypothetical protein